MKHSAPHRVPGTAKQQSLQMASQTASYVVVALCLLVLVARHAEAKQPRLVPAIFVFGDSTVDVGNNNFLGGTRKEGKANFPQYGVDFPTTKPTGRFSNGFNTADLLAQLLGFPLSPPAYLSLNRRTVRSQMFKGLNFASAGSGLGDHTGRSVVGEVITMTQQVESFATVVKHMHQSSGSRRTASLLSKSIFFISTGSNDVFEYSFSRSNDRKFLAGLVAAYKDYLKALYHLGARKFSIVSIPPLGCTPLQRLRRLEQMGTQGCFDPLNDLSLGSYPLLAAMMEELAHELPGMAYSLGDAFAMVSFVFANPHTPDWSFTELEAACCGEGPFGASGCNQTVPLCGNRDSYLFWDANHPTQAVSTIAAETLFAGNHTFVKPVNVLQLTKL
ncbi:GDSL esterase/lipase At1g29660-like [Triticum dicoccoides]|uniref:GDSL esterase/lipase At1g29660-like n=1 Tax=Triticum dicoccoides TaxID=85692 RepID=UPI0018914199|nr:GDSL esterase/lipase At1g29660-like [Triticum dicoccoides]